MRSESAGAPRDGVICSDLATKNSRRMHKGGNSAKGRSEVMHICEWVQSFKPWVTLVFLLCIFRHSEGSPKQMHCKAETYCHINRDCPSPTEILILLIWLWIYFDCFFFFVYICSLWSFLSFCALAFIGFLLLSKDAFFMISCFFFNCNWLIGNATPGFCFS